MCPRERAAYCRRVKKRGPKARSAVDEAFRILGREHQADLDREALKRQWAAAARVPRARVALPRRASKQWRIFLFRAKEA
jgi:hypothetical protein